jgi:hypothetical protein
VFCRTLESFYGSIQFVTFGDQEGDDVVGWH